MGKPTEIDLDGPSQEKGTVGCLSIPIVIACGLLGLAYRSEIAPLLHTSEPIASALVLAGVAAVWWLLLKYKFAEIDVRYLKEKKQQQSRLI